MRCYVEIVIWWVVLLSLVDSTHAENWPQWRGPRSNGVSGEAGLPTTWSKTENVAWRLTLPGPAGSTPVVWGDSIFLTSVDGNDLVLLKCSTEGNQIWRKVVATGNKSSRGDEGNSASPSPCTDGKHVWTFMGTGDLACYDFDGRAVWKFNVQDRYGKFNIMWGMASTPLLDGDRLYLQLLHSGSANVVALDKLTGNEIWRQTRNSDARDECRESYASPVIYRDDKQEFLLTHGADYIVAHDLKNGAEIWRSGGLNIGGYNPTLRLVASPTTAPGIIVVPSAKKGPVLALSPGSHGDITESSAGHLWSKLSGTPDVPSPLIYDGLVYLCDEGGLVSCIDAATGKEYYQKKRTHPDRHRASPMYTDGKILITSRDGHITVVKPGKEFKILASNDMQESISASPAASNGTLYLRTFDALYAIRDSNKK
ncbi:MAG: PQQ-binding-like beta-propeller repeat protein [Pirellulales bacterium]|nr:PQQ-binding-like beta-propeller repeat protein [Pirellulales bacterium]